MFCNYLLNQTLTPHQTLFIFPAYFLQIQPTKAKAIEDGEKLFDIFRDLIMHVSSTLRGGLTFGNLGVKYRGITKYEMVVSLQCRNGVFNIVNLKY